MDSNKSWHDVYRSVLPDHPLFGETCEDCGDLNHEAQQVLGMASSMGQQVAEHLMSVGLPPEMVGFVLSVVAASAATMLGQHIRQDPPVTTTLDAMPRIEEMLTDLAECIPAEIERVRAAATELAIGETAGSC